MSKDNRDNGRRPEKRKKMREETLPSPPSPLDVEQLQELLAKWERKYKRACRGNFEVQQRADRAETLLEDKQGVLASAAYEELNGVKEKLAEVTKQLEASRTRADNAFLKKVEIGREKDALKEELADMKCTVRKLQEEARKNSNSDSIVSELKKENEMLKKVIDEMSEKAVYASDRLKDGLDYVRRLELDATEAVKKELEGLRRKEEVASSRNSELIIELSKLKEQLANIKGKKENAIQSKLVLSNDISDRKKELKDARRKEDNNVPIITIDDDELEYSEPTCQTASPSGTTAKTVKKGSRKLPQVNIFRACPNIPGSHERTISIDRALSKIESKLDECGKEKFQLYCDQNDDMIEKRLNCVSCEKTLKKCVALDHFLSTEHIKQARAFGGAVSLSAVQYWLQELQKAASN